MVGCSLILSAVRDASPITADVAAFPVQGDHTTINHAHQLVWPGHRLYTSRGNPDLRHSHSIGNLQGGQPPRTAILYVHQPECAPNLSEAAWFAQELARPSVNPEVLIVAPKYHLPRVYMAVLTELIRQMQIRCVDDYAKLPLIIPCISPTSAPESAEEESTQLITRERGLGTLVSHEQLLRYLSVKGLKK